MELVEHLRPDFEFCLTPTPCNTIAYDNPRPFLIILSYQIQLDWSCKRILT